MRIISGIAKGRRLVAPDGMQTRPTQDKTREALFSMIQAYVPNACVLDLFGGTGALALEAMSRGASKAVICDISRPAQKAIETNIMAVLGETDTVTLIKADYRVALKQLDGQSFDLVFLDPPYADEAAYLNSLTFILEHDMLSDGALVIVEKRKDIVICYPDGFQIIKSRNYSDTTIELLTKEETL